MILKHGVFENIAQRVKSENIHIIVYGAGMIGQVIAPYWLHRYQVDDRVLCYVDADPYKEGQYVQFASKNIPIEPLSALEKIVGRYILLVTVSAFAPIIQTMEKISGTERAELYFLPIMLLDHAHAPKKGGVIKTSDKQLIPKKIHYCWFSGAPIPEKFMRCIDSWKHFCPDYEIIRWDESNYDIHKNKYMEQAYTCKKWGFIPDIARLDILYQHGGIYLDTDVELLRNLDDLLYQPAFCGVEKWGNVAMGGGCGAQPGNRVIKAILDYRADIPFLYRDGQMNLTTCGYYETLPLIQMGVKVNGETQVIDDGMMTVYSSDFFLPFDYVSGETNRTKNTFSIHYYSGTWMGPEAEKERQRTRQQYRMIVDRLEV